MRRFQGGDEATDLRLLTGVFLRRLIDNDLISPHADRHESLALLCATVVSVAVFVTFFLSTNYLAAFIQLPGPTALSALSDRFLFISASMAISALAALIVWDALSLETRDAAILGPLPLSARTIIRAKLAAIVVFAAVLAVALNAVPSVLYPAFLTINMRGMSVGGLLRLIAAHATTVVRGGSLRLLRYPGGAGHPASGLPGIGVRAGIDCGSERARRVLGRRAALGPDRARDRAA